MAESYLNRIIKTDTETGYVRLAGVPDGESIIANAPVIENGGVNYYPIYYMCLMDTLASESFTKTGTGVSSGADAYVFSDEPSTLYVGDTTHTFDVADDYATSENWKCRYVIAYATEANKNDANGITVNLYSYRTTFEFIGSQYLKLSATSALFGQDSAVINNVNLRYVNLSSSSFYNNEISVSGFCKNCWSLGIVLLPTITTISGGYFLRAAVLLKTLSLPELTTISGTYFLQTCYTLKTLSLPELENVSGEYFCHSCASLKTLSLPMLTTISGNYFCGACNSMNTLLLPALTTVSVPQVCQSGNSLEYFAFPNTITSITNTTIDTLNHVQFIGLPTDFDIDACNFTGYATNGYSKSLAWFTHLATQLKDNSGGTAKTMTLGATNIALIPSAQATIISNKNWTIN